MIFTLLLAIATISPTPTPTIAPTPTTGISEEIQKIREVVQQKVKEKLNQISNPTTSKKSIIGKAIQVSPTEITIENKNYTRMVSLSADTTYVDLKRNKSNLAALKIGQDIMIMGIENSTDNTFAAKRVVFSDFQTFANKKTSTIGKIVDISRTSPIFTLIPTNNKNSLFQIKTDAKTEVIDKNQKVILLPNLKSGHKIIVIMVPDPKISKTYYAQKIIDFDYTPPTPTPVPTKK